jgi:Mrp family chromosome partitioning ATPase
MAEAFKDAVARVAGFLVHRGGGARCKALLITSAHPGEGVTTATLALARHFQLAYDARALIVEMNRYQPRLGAQFNLDPGRDIEAIAAGDRTPDECVHKVNDLAMIPCSRTPAVSTFGPRVGNVLGCIRNWADAEYDFLLADMPPILCFPEVQASAGAMAQILLVVRAGRSSFDDMAQVRRAADAGHITIAGTLLNAQRNIVPRWLSRMMGR